MTIPASNVRPRVFDFGTVTGENTVTETVTGNIIFVVTFISVTLQGEGNEWSAVQLDNSIAALVAIPNPAPTTAPRQTTVLCDIALENESEIQIVANTTAGTTTWIIAGYTWAHGIPIE
jgi:hypothetical protein